MAIWGSRKQQAAKGSRPVWYVLVDGGDTRRVPKGYIPMVLAGDGGEDEKEQGQRILVHVTMLRKPCMAALLEMAEQQFGHGQRGVLRIPCSVACFDQMIDAMISKAAERV